MRYRMATMVPASRSDADERASAVLPAFSMRNGELAMQHGFHQEIGWELAKGYLKAAPPCVDAAAEPSRRVDRKCPRHGGSIALSRGCS